MVTRVPLLLLLLARPTMERWLSMRSVVNTGAPEVALHPFFAMSLRMEDRDRASLHHFCVRIDPRI